MNIRDASLPIDARLYAFRQYQSVFSLPEWPSLAQWKKDRQHIRKHLWLCSGLNEQTSAFKAHGRVVKAFEHEGLVVENISIETLPGLYVQGNLYRPKAPKGKLPLVLNPHGHGMYSRTVPMNGFSVPHRAMNQALNGLAAFAWSMTAHDKDSMQIEHRGLLQGDEKRLCNLLGLSTFGLQLNNSIKILDYLCARDDIDTRRIGCTGESGGGTQTYYLAAVDDRVKVAAPAVMLSGHYQGGCVCENAPLLHLHGYSTVHYAALIAPRPLLLPACTGDWTHHAMEREFASLRDLYRLYGKEDAIDSFYQDERHNYNRATRERVYAWMVRWLKDPAFTDKRIPESEKPVPATDKLLVFNTPVPPRKNAITTQDGLIRMWTRLHAKPDGPDNAARMLNLDMPAKSDILVRNMTPRYAYRASKKPAQNTITYGRFSESSSLVCRFVVPDPGKRCFLIVRNWKDQAQWRKAADRPSKAVRGLIENGHGVLMPLLLGQQSTPFVDQNRSVIEESYLFTSYNKTSPMHQAGDILTTVGLADTEFRIPSSSLAIVADRDMSLVAFIAWAFLCSQTVIGPFAGDMGGMDLCDPAVWAKRAYFPLILRAGGIKDLAQLCKGGKASISGVPAACRSLFPRGFKITEPSLGLEAIISAAEGL